MQFAVEALGEHLLADGPPGRAFEGNTVETTTMLPTIQAFIKAHRLPAGSLGPPSPRCPAFARRGVAAGMSNGAPAHCAVIPSEGADADGQFVAGCGVARRRADVAGQGVQVSDEQVTVLGGGVWQDVARVSVVVNEPYAERERQGPVLSVQVMDPVGEEVVVARVQDRLRSAVIRLAGQSRDLVGGLERGMRRIPQTVGAARRSAYQVSGMFTRTA